MANSASIEFNFKGNLAQLRRDLNEAARLAKQSAGSVSRDTQGGFAGLFRRSPERRAELAFHSLARDLSSGDVAGALTNFAGRLSGLGLAAGIGVGVAIGFLDKARQEADKASEAVGKLDDFLRKPSELRLGVGEGGIAEQIGELSKLSSDAEKSQTFLARLWQGAFHPSSLRLNPTDPNSIAARDQQNQKRQEDAAKLLAQLKSQQADEELKIANLQLQSAQGSEREVALAKVALEFEEKRAQLLLSRSGNALDLYKSELALEVNARAARLNIDKKFPEAFTPVTSADTDFSTAPIPGGRLAGIGESQWLVNGVEASRINVERLNAGLPAIQSWMQDIAPQGFFNDYLNDPAGAIDRAFFGGPRSYQDSSGSSAESIGTGIDGIKAGIDQLNSKMDRYWS